MEENNKRDRNRALAGTIVFHVVLVLCFLFFGLSTPLPLPEEHGVLVSLGYVEDGIGQTQPLSSPPPVPQSPPSSPEPEPERIVTQDTRESIALPDEVSETETDRDMPESDRRDPVPEPLEAAEEIVEEEPEPQVDPRAMFPGRDQRSTDRRDQGETERSGDQGRPEGAIGANEYGGIGPGEGIEYSLTGRKANFLPLPDYTTLATGRVVVQITVNRQGQVIRATAGARGTTTTDRTLHRQAEEAARKARFDLKNDAPEEQTGTITYNFIRLN
jgi:colicin import membrane protein